MSFFSELFGLGGGDAAAPAAAASPEPPRARAPSTGAGAGAGIVHPCSRHPDRFNQGWCLCSLPEELFSPRQDGPSSKTTGAAGHQDDSLPRGLFKANDLGLPDDHAELSRWSLPYQPDLMLIMQQRSAALARAQQEDPNGDLLQLLDDADFDSAAGPDIYRVSEESVRVETYLSMLEANEQGGSHELPAGSAAADTSRLAAAIQTKRQQRRKAARDQAFVTRLEESALSRSTIPGSPTAGSAAPAPAPAPPKMIMAPVDRNRLGMPQFHVDIFRSELIFPELQRKGGLFSTVTPVSAEPARPSLYADNAPTTVQLIIRSFHNDHLLFDASLNEGDPALGAAGVRASAASAPAAASAGAAATAGTAPGAAAASASAAAAAPAPTTTTTAATTDPAAQVADKPLLTRQVKYVLDIPVVVISRIPALKAHLLHVPEGATEAVPIARSFVLEVPRASTAEALSRLLDLVASVHFILAGWKSGKTPASSAGDPAPGTRPRSTTLSSVASPVNSLMLTALPIELLLSHTAESQAFLNRIWYSQKFAATRAAAAAAATGQKPPAEGAAMASRPRPTPREITDLSLLLLAQTARDMTALLSSVAPAQLPAHMATNSAAGPAPPASGSIFSSEARVGLLNTVAEWHRQRNLLLELFALCHLLGLGGFLPIITRTINVLMRDDSDLGVPVAYLAARHNDETLLSMAHGWVLRSLLDPGRLQSALNVLHNESFNPNPNTNLSVDLFKPAGSESAVRLIDSGSRLSYRRFVIPLYVFQGLLPRRAWYNLTRMPPSDRTVCRLVRDLRPITTGAIPGSVGLASADSQDSITSGAIVATYTLYEMPSHRALLSARFDPNTSEYVICAGREVIRHGPSYVGGLRYNLAGTVFTVFNHGTATCLTMPAVVENISPPRSEQAIITYDLNFWGLEPRSFHVALPKQVRDLSSAPPLEEQIAHQEAASDFYQIQNKSPKWNEERATFTLDFRGNVRCASKKNFILELPAADADSQPTEVMMMGKLERNHFYVHFNAPLTPLATFGIILSSFHRKLMVK
ncbi:hypothetical protein H696_03324 [Fonticula alba]|uniref:Tubby C-terminal domain-containing protein n=1 Tax=Fonticula alba TaxID=691883 RepID=A0A058Z6V0_FONAL|nr:hypothetical protein H696_03324 [Fonticula alba]KCV69851.1 hypothetical protein H696_03324 [Fonticula alba]|eukprot:XP_009495457.1 hypothetical protein H696_03324 [Fonticula alba]